MQPYLPIRRLPLDRRGITGVVFAITATVLVGVSALATEAALWYLAREQAYGVADAAALAGAVQYANDASGTDAISAATTLASVNGFGAAQTAGNWIAGASSSTVVVNNPPSMGVYAGTSGYTEVKINVGFQPYLASLFHPDAINVAVRSVAGPQQVGAACLLSLSGPLTLAMNVDGRYSYPCYFASNATDATAVTLLNSPNLITHGITTTGACTNCPSVDPLWGAPQPGTAQTAEYDRPTAAYQPATTNPLAGLANSVTYPSYGQFQCPLAQVNWTYPNGSPPLDANHCPTILTSVTITGGTFAQTSPASATSACGVGNALPCAYYNLDITLSSAVNVQSGTYLHLNSTLNIGPSAVVTPAANNVAGETFIFAGVSNPPQKDPGALTIDPTASVKLSAPSNASSPLNEVLFYRDPINLAADSAATPAVTIADNLTNASGPSVFNGIMYFPGAYVWFAGNVSLTPGGVTPPCSVVIAGTLNIGYLNNAGNASNYVAVSGACGNYAAANQMPAVQAVQVVE